MYSFRQVPTASSIFSAYASISASAMLLRTAVNEFIPQPFRGYLQSTVSQLFKKKSNKLTLIIEESNQISRNELYDAAELYLCKKISPNADRLKVSKYPKDNHFTIKFETGEKIFDSFEGIKLKWVYVCHDLVQSKGDDRHSNLSNSSGREIRHFELSFDKENKEQIINNYFPHVMEKSKEIRDDRKTLKLCTLGNNKSMSGRISWEQINLDHASTFDTLAMDPEMKKEIKDDLDRFVRRKDYYRRVGRAWKRGYLLYGPPGTGKSSLIGAMANYLRFDIYDLQLGNLKRDSDLRRVLLATGNRSILVIEDIDCTVDIPNRKSKRRKQEIRINNQNNEKNTKSPEVQLTLSGLLNFIDGLWSSCGDERIIIFTTNNKERLDPALLRPGRMDMHIHMSYLTAPGFKTLASNYLNLKGQPEHQLFRDIERMIGVTNVSPAQVAEELMRSEDADVALEGVVKLLKRKKAEDEEAKIEFDGCFGKVNTSW